MKRQPTEWDTIFANNASYKKIPKINKLTQLSIQKKKKEQTIQLKNGQRL